MDSKEYKVTKANAYNGWDPLKQVILGNVFEPEFFEDIGDPKLRDLLQQILYETHEDLNNIKKTLEDLGVDVVQPPRNTIAQFAATDNSKEFTSIAAAADGGQIQGMPKPCLMPRDYYITLGNEICFGGYMYAESDAHYLFKPGVVDYWEDKPYEFWAPYITRVGNRLIIDQEACPDLSELILERYPIFEGANVVVGGHNDGTFNLPKPGLVVCTPYVDKNIFKNTLPGWDILQIEDPNIMHWGMNESWAEERIITRGRWWHPEAKSNPEFVKFVDSWLNEWVGFAEESIFEVNMFSINEETILSLNYQREVHNKLKQYNIEPIYCRFRHRNFWDGGLHCLTLDTVREGGMQDYFK